MTREVCVVRLDSLNGAGASSPWFYGTEDAWIPDFAASIAMVEHRVAQAFYGRRDMYGQNKTTGDSPIGNGVVRLLNSDGVLDPLRTYSFDGQGMTLQRFDADSALSNIDGTGNGYRSGIIEQPTFDDDEVVFQVRDFLHRLDVPILKAQKYGGTNVLPAGIDGTASDIKGQYKPLCVGTCKNVTPVCVNTSKLIYQVDGQGTGLRTGWTLSAYDKRAALTKGADYVSQADMEATAPAAGGYRVWPAGGCFRLNATPTLLTCDVLNPVTPTTDGINDVITYLTAYVYGTTWNGPYFTTNDLHVGIYIQDGRTALEAILEVLRSVNGFMCNGGKPSTTGTINTSLPWGSHLTDPASLPYTARNDSIPLDESSILKGSFKRIVAAENTRGLPIWRVNLKYSKNYTVMGATDLAGVALATQATYAQEYLEVVAEDASVKTQWPYAPELSVTTLLTDATQAATEAARLLALFKVQRDMFVLRVPKQHIRDNIAGTGADFRCFQLQSRVTITMNRYGLDAGKLFLVIGLQEDMAADVFELTVWG
jgi:hypothetical protein